MAVAQSPPPDLTQTRLTIDCSLLASESAAGVLAAHAERYALVANAEHLVLVLVDEQRALLDADMNPSAVEAMSGVIQRLGRIAQTIDVLFGDSDHPMDWKTLGRLNSALAPDAAAVGARRLCTLRAYTAIAAEPDELPTGLAGISLALTEGKSQVMEFLHANAATLERLEIAVTDATKLYRLLANAVDEPVLYPELRTLILSPRGDPLEYAMIKRSTSAFMATRLILKIASNVERIEIGDHSYGRGIPMLFSDPGVMLGNLTTIRLKEEREAVQYRVYHRELANIHFVATK
ncbi:hypothetical protein IWQ56_001197 [Coemansia nantahalensis]|nr:hypothetical protein IWQ56_001197 [Coemansia nantahalensis]